ncbi:hypothetical protein L1049_000169 [Liquidambar formosana]|uniref:DUF4220 domain-containing protein n=1 Tax=Liquidambar formosana TaxID=63359 RepID=A0AAP0NBV5_LIQFO
MNIRGLIVDLTYGYREWQRTREFFFKMTAIDAFRIMEVELNFLYDMLYTKMVVVHSKYGFIFRFVCLLLIVLALERFVSHHKQHQNIADIDIYITYTLLIGGIGLDILGIIKLILSDWTIATLSDVWTYAVLKKCKDKLVPCLYALRMNLSFDRNYRWSRSISQYSLITYCLKERFKCITNLVKFFGATDLLDEIQFKKTVHVKNNQPDDNNLKTFIFKELREKALEAKNAKDAKEICSWRGEGVLLKASRFYPSLAESVKVEYDESVLRWHVATELCYYKDDDDAEKNKNKERQFCKILSQYMLYLLVMRPTMMSEVTGILQIRFQDTREEAKKFLLSKEEQPKNYLQKIMNFFGRGTQPHLKEACKKLLEVDTVIEPYKVKAGTSKSVLFDGCMMANDLQKMGETERWTIMSKVWVELLSYAASHCKAHAHAQQLSKGGEFVTFVWLLMFRLGMGEQFRVDPESRYKLIVGKDWLEDSK